MDSPNTPPPTPSAMDQALQLARTMTLEGVMERSDSVAIASQIQRADLVNIALGVAGRFATIPVENIASDKDTMMNFATAMATADKLLASQEKSAAAMAQKHLARKGIETTDTNMQALVAAFMSQSNSGTTVLPSGEEVHPENHAQSLQALETALDEQFQFPETALRVSPMDLSESKS